MTKLVLTAVAVLIAASACATISGDDQIEVSQFEESNLEVGRVVRVSGFLKYEFENRNIYPTRKWKQDRRLDRCIPIGIAGNQRELSKKAETLDGSFVTVVGKVEDLVQDDEISTSFCRDIGLKVYELQEG